MPRKRKKATVAGAASAHRMKQLAGWLNDDEPCTLWIAPGGRWYGGRGHFPPLEGLLFSLALNGFDTYDVALCVRFFHCFAKPGVDTRYHVATGNPSHPLCNSRRYHRCSVARCVVPETHPGGMDPYEAFGFVSPINLQLLQPWLDGLTSNDISHFYCCLERAVAALDVDALRILLNYLPDEVKGHAYREKGQELLVSAIRGQRDHNKILVSCIKMLCSAYDLPPIFLERAVVNAIRLDFFDVFQTLIECGVGPCSVSDWKTVTKEHFSHLFPAPNAATFGCRFPTKVRGSNRDRRCTQVDRKFQGNRLLSFVEIVISTLRLDPVLTKEDKESIVVHCIFSILKCNCSWGFDVSRAIELLLRHVTIIDPNIRVPSVVKFTRGGSRHNNSLDDEFGWECAAAGGVPTLKVLDPYLSPKPTAAVVAKAVFYAFHQNRGSGADGSPNDASTIIQDTLEYLLEYSPDAIRDYDALDDIQAILDFDSPYKTFHPSQYSTLELALQTDEGTTLVPFLLSHGAFLSNAEGVYSCYTKLSSSSDEFRMILSHPNVLTVLRHHPDTIMNKALKLGLKEPSFVHILLELGADPTATVDSEPLVVSAAKIGRSALQTLSNDGTVKFPPDHLVEALEAASRLGKTTTTQLGKTTAVCYLCHRLGACICDEEKRRTMDDRYYYDTTRQKELQATPHCPLGSAMAQNVISTVGQQHCQQHQPTDFADYTEELASWVNAHGSTLWIGTPRRLEWDDRSGHFPPLEGLLFSLALNGFDTYDVALCVRFFHSFAKPGYITREHHFATGDASHPLCNSRKDLTCCVVPETHPGVMDAHLACYFVSPINLQLLHPWLDDLASNDIDQLYRFLERVVAALDVDALRILLNYLPDEVKGHAYREKGQKLLVSAIRGQRDQDKVFNTPLVSCIKMLCSAYDLPPTFLEGAVVGAVRFDSLDVFKTLIECGVGPRSFRDWKTTVNNFFPYGFSASTAATFGYSFPTKVRGSYRGNKLLSFVEIVISTFKVDTVLTKEDKESIVIHCIFSILERNSGAGYDVSRVIATLVRHATTIDPTVPFRFASRYTNDEYGWQYAAAGGVQTLKVLDPYLSPKPTAANVARAVFYAFHQDRGSGADGSPNDASTIIQDTLEYLLGYSPDAIRDYDALDDIQYSTLALALHTEEGTTLVPFLLLHGAFLSNAKGVYSCYTKLSSSSDEFRTILSHPNTLTVLRHHPDTIMNKALKLGLKEPSFVHILLELGADPTATVDSEPLVVSAAEIGRSALQTLSNDGTVKFPPDDLVKALEAAARLGKTSTICYLCHVLGACICDDEH